jgi:DNA-binding NtrC family response regulator
MSDMILLVDDEIDLTNGIKRSISPKIDCDVLTAASGKEALDLIEAKAVDLVLTDISMPGMDGLELLQSIMDFDDNVTVIMMTAYGTIDNAVKALKMGAYDFVQKPLDFDYLVRLIRKGIEHNRLVRENTRLQRKICEQAPLENLVGSSKAMQTVRTQIQTLAKTDVPVLIVGETGTGKDLAAQAIHALSHRRHKELVTVNCPALPEGLLESELFGHTKGSFTGALQNKKGLFDQADDGTIFLDEIGDLPNSLQTKLLRVLQSNEVKPVGANLSHHTNTRILAATNQDLAAKIESGNFRADLFYRLNVTSLLMPPLREISDDIPLLVKYFLEKTACELNIETKTTSADVLTFLISREWPGNTRELENTIRGWTATLSENVIQIEHISAFGNPLTESAGDLMGEETYKDLKDRAIEKFTRSYLTKLLTRTQGNVTLSAKISGIKRQSLQKIINRYGIDIESYRKKLE